MCAEINFSGNIQYHLPTPQYQYQWPRSVRKDNTLLIHYTTLLYAKEKHKSVLVIPRSQVFVSRYQFSGYSLKRTESAPWHRLSRTLTVHSDAEKFRGCHGSRFTFAFTILTNTLFSLLNASSSPHLNDLHFLMSWLIYGPFNDRLRNKFSYRLETQFFL